MLDDIDHRYTETPVEEYLVYKQYEGVVSDGLPRGFATISRKVDVYSEAMIRLARTGFPYMYLTNSPPATITTLSARSTSRLKAR